MRLGAALVDQFGLFGMVRRPVDALRLAGLATIVVGIAIMEAARTELHWRTPNQEGAASQPLRRA
jgi:hypothetical protein